MILVPLMVVRREQPVQVGIRDESSSERGRIGRPAARSDICFSSSGIGSLRTGSPDTACVILSAILRIWDAASLSEWSSITVCPAASASANR